MVTGTSTKAGFSLIEILVVLLIIGISLGFTFLAFGDFGERRNLLMSTARLKESLQFLQEMALLENKSYKLELYPNRVEVFEFMAKQRYQPITSPSSLRQLYFPGTKSLKLPAGSRPEPIQINNAGELSPFSLEIQDKKGRSVIRLHNQAGPLLEEALAP